MTDKILVWINVDLIHFGLAKFLQEKIDAELYGIVDIQDVTKDFFVDQKIVNFKKSWFYRDNIKDIHSPDMEYLKNFEKNYGINLWELVYSEIIFFDHIRYHKFSDNEILCILEQECKLFEQILHESKPDYFLVNAYSSHSTHLLSQMCDKKGVKIIMFTPTRVGFRVALTSHYDVLDIFDSSVESCKSNTIRTESELKNYLNKYSIVKHNEEDAARFDKRISKTNELLSIIKFLKFLSGNKEYRKFYGNFGKTPQNIINREIKLRLKKFKRNRYVEKNSIKNINLDELFVYFPLQVEPERILSFGSPYYYNQLELLTLVAKALPVNFKLYVKEHPMMYTTEGRSISYYESIKNLSNVHLVHTSVKPQEMLKNCSLVTAINGTAALEAAFYGKPSITFGNNGYSFLPSVNVVKNLDDLPKVIHSALEMKIDLSKLNDFIDYMEANTFEFDSRKLEFDVAKTFFHGGYLGNVEITNEKMSTFLENHKNEFESLTKEHIKKIQFYEQKKFDNVK